MPARSSEAALHVVERAWVVGLGEDLLGRPGLDDVARARSRRRGRTRSACDTRCACCMLWVTITIVTSWAISAIVSSMRRVDVGSSAEHGSSMSSTRGCTASARAMHSRCCWPPESAPPGVGEAVRHLVPQPGPLAGSSPRSSSASAPSGILMPDELQARQHVLGDAHGRERVRLLEHHADLAAGLGGGASAA